MAGERILVVDDGPDNIKFIVDYVLKPNGYVPLVAHHGAEGLHKALTENPDLMLLDMQMPKMTGIEVLSALQGQGKDIPVILMTFHGSESLAVNAFRLGARNYVIKPFEVTEMLQAIDRALAESRLRRERDELLERLVGVNRQLEQRVKELNILYSIGKSITFLLDLDSLFSRLVDAAVYITGAEEGWLMLVDDKTSELYVCAAKGLEEKQARSLRLRVDDSLAGAVIKSGEPIVLGGGGEHRLKTSYMVKALVAVPVKIGQRTIGVLNVDYRISERAFGSNAMHLLAALADYAAIAIQNARLFTDVQDARAKLQAILEGTSDAILVIDEESRILLSNNAVFQALKLDAGTLVGKSVDQVALPKELRRLVERAATTRTDVYDEIPLTDGRTLYAHLTIVPGVGQVVVMQDITQLKNLEQIKNEFVSTVSHDLRSPLTSIRGFVDLIEMTGPLTERQKSFAEKIRQGVTAITELITDLLDLERIETGAGFEMTPVSLPEIILESVDTLRGHAIAKNHSLDVSSPHGLSPVLGNRIRLGQVVKNLVGNAIKYTPEGGHIRVWAEEQAGQVLVSVQDDGIGISAQDQTKLFQKFYRVKSDQTDSIPGTGLGLSITRSIVEQHGGRVWVDSELGHGSTFTFLLPAYKIKAVGK